jgi:hypothetical protein
MASYVNIILKVKDINSKSFIENYNEPAVVACIVIAVVLVLVVVDSLDTPPGSLQA